MTDDDIILSVIKLQDMMAGKKIDFDDLRKLVQAVRRTMPKSVGVKITFDDYQEAAGRTAIYPDRGNNFVYPVLGLSGEVGEIAEKIKKILRDQKGEVTDTNRAEISKELGDVLWYVSQLAFELKLSLLEIAEANILKLMSRKDRGVLGGSGDNR